MRFHLVALRQMRAHSDRDRFLADTQVHRAAHLLFGIALGDPPFSLWEHPPQVGRIPPHRSDAGSYLLAECFGCATVTLIKDVDGLYDKDPKAHPGARFIPAITVAELRERNLPTLPFDRVLIDLLAVGRLVTRLQVINGLKPDLLEPALNGEHVGTLITKE